MPNLLSEIAIFENEVVDQNCHQSASQQKLQIIIAHFMAWEYKYIHGVPTQNINR